MNGADLFVIAVIVIFSAFGIYRGLIRSLASVVTGIASSVISLVGYPLVCSYVRTTQFFETVRESVIVKLGLRQMALEGTKHGQNMFIDSLPLPDAFKEKLEVNNNPVIYDLLGVDNIVDYIGGFIANIIINVLVGLIMFLVSYIIIHVVLSTIFSLKKISVVKTFDRAFGGFIGCIFGLLVIWGVFAAAEGCVTVPLLASLYESIQKSHIAIWLYEYDIIRAFMMSRMF